MIHAYSCLDCRLGEIQSHLHNVRPLIICSLSLYLSLSLTARTLELLRKAPSGATSFATWNWPCFVVRENGWFAWLDKPHKKSTARALLTASWFQYRWQGRWGYRKHLVWQQVGKRIVQSSWDSILLGGVLRTAPDLRNCLFFVSKAVIK